MSDKHFIGLDLTGLEDNGLRPGISKVTLLLDDEHAVTDTLVSLFPDDGEENDIGAELTADCPYATQEMVEAILAQTREYRYRMFSATDAALDPAAELGDGVTVGGMYSILARISEDGSGYCGITAPGEAELEDEFPTGGFLTKAFNLKITQVRSSIKKTAEEITLLVEDTAGSLSSAFSVELEKITLRVAGTEDSVEAALDLVNGFTVTDSSGTTRIKGSSIDTSTIKANSISADKLNLTGAITFADLNANTQTKINNAASSAAAAQSTVSGWAYPGTTYIDGTKIMANTVIASKLQGGTVNVLSQSGEIAATMTINMNGATGDRRGALTIESDALSLQTTHRDGMLNLFNTGGISQSGLALAPDGTIKVVGHLMPMQDGMYNIGFSNFRWNVICLQSPPMVTSDRTKKEEINYGLDRYEAFFDTLRPASFRFVDGQSGRTHLGMVSQDIEEELEATGLTDMDFAGFIRSPRRDKKGNEIEGELDYMLRYEEFIPLCVDQIQKLKARVAVLEGRLAQ